MLTKLVIYNSFSPWQFDILKAKDSFIWDGSGSKLIDFTSGWNVVNLGWNHPEVNDAAVKQLKTNTYAPMWTADPIQVEYAKTLTNSLPKKLNAIARATGGTEANEEALKTARAYTQRKKILGFYETYHGQSFATLAIGKRSQWKSDIAPLVSKFIHMEYPNIFKTNKSKRELLSDFASNLENILKKEDVAAIIMEPSMITGWGSVYVGPKGFTSVARKLTKKYGTLLILDEVGTGFSRCGELYGMYIENIEPDIVTFAKGQSNGVAAIGTMVTTAEISNKTFDKTNLTSTFGWTPVACAAALATLQIHKRDKIWLQSRKKGQYLLKILNDELQNNPRIGDIRGIGMEIGIDFVTDKKSNKPDLKFAYSVKKNAHKKGLHLVLGEEGVIQIMPPLTIKQKVLDQGIEILIDTIKDLS